MFVDLLVYVKFISENNFGSNISKVYKSKNK